jgi:hypothetical protein
VLSLRKAAGVAFGEQTHHVVIINDSKGAKLDFKLSGTSAGMIADITGPVRWSTHFHGQDYVAEGNLTASLGVNVNNSGRLTYYALPGGKIEFTGSLKISGQDPPPC